MDAEEYYRFRQDCVHALTKLNERCDKEFRISSWARWDYDLDRGTLTFSQDGSIRVIASILVAGTTSTSGGTWLWSWANGYLPEAVSAPVKRVQEFGVAEDLAALTEAYAVDDESVGWEMTAIAARVMGAKGAYRCPGENGCTYVLFTDLAFADRPKYQSREQIQCNTHGTSLATFLCEHLVSVPTQVWFSDEPTEDNPCPDAWCAGCNSFFEEQGEWNARNSEHLSIKLLCHKCYQDFRRKAQPAKQS